MQGRFSPATTLFPLLLVGLLAGMTYWLELASRPPAVANDGKSRHDPDYIVETFEVRRYGPEGNLQHTLRAAQMRHYPDDDSTVVLSPDLTYHNIPPTFIRANEARLDSKGKHVQLIDAVRVARSGANGRAETVLTTAKLDTYPDDEIATSDQPVTITQGKTVVTGSGLKANNKTSMYVLEGPVHGIFHRREGQAATAQVDPARPAASAAPAAAAKPKGEAQPKKTRTGAKNNAKAKSNKTKTRPQARPTR
jgi:lipopolysaccharide export system protein LptC